MTGRPLGSSANLRQVDPTIVERMRRDVIAETDEMLNRQFGISYNTWRKVRSSQAIRASVADRLEERVGRTTMHCKWGAI